MVDRLEVANTSNTAKTFEGPGCPGQFLLDHKLDVKLAGCKTIVFCFGASGIGGDIWIHKSADVFVHFASGYP